MMPKSSTIPTSQSITVQVPTPLYTALQERCQATGDSVDYVVQQALAKALGIEHHTLYQVSTSTALVQGVYQGYVNVGTIKSHGDFGLGTYDGLEGEGLMLDGHVWQALSNGSVIEAADSSSVPFWVSTAFEADREATLDSVENWEELCNQLDAHRRSNNLFAAIRIEGIFDQIHYRVACKSADGTDLVTATRQQAEFTLRGCRGSLMGFWSPTYARTLNIPGYHLHLISSDHHHGGHVLNIQAKNLTLQIMDINHFVMALPESPLFLTADLSGDPSAALQKAEGPLPTSSPSEIRLGNTKP